MGEGFLYADAHDWARFGEFLRLGGEWNGEQLLPMGFVDYMRSPVPASDEGRGPVYGRGGVWLARGEGFNLPADTFMLQGHLRQVILRMGLAREDIGTTSRSCCMRLSRRAHRNNRQKFMSSAQP